MSGQKTSARRRFLGAALLLIWGLAAAGCMKRRPAALPEAAGQRPKIGLALGGGGARGFAEVGVLRVLEQEKIPIDLVVGTSVGSLIGALYADSGRVLDLEFEAIAVQEEDLFDRSLRSLWSGGLVKGERLEAFLQARLKHKTIESLPIPFAAVATDLSSGRTVVLDRGEVPRAVHASAAIPGLFVPVEWNGRTLVDGGVTDPVPAAIARQRGADVVIAVSIPPGISGESPRNPIQIALRAVTLMSAEIGTCRGREADVLITPEVGNIAYDDFSQKKRLLEAGSAAARAALPQIREAMAKKSPPLRAR